MNTIAIWWHLKHHHRVLHCICCDGHCGPDNGCNCADCKALDEQEKKTQKQTQTKINSAGVMAKKGKTIYMIKITMMICS